MVSHKRYTQINLNPRGANLLPSADVPPVSSDLSVSRDTQIPQDDTAGSANRKLVDSTRPVVEQETRRPEPSPPDDLHPSRQWAPAEVPTGRDGAGKLNAKRRNNEIDGAKVISASEPRHQNLPALARSAAWQDTPLRVKEESPWRTYDEGYNLRVGGSVTVAKKKRPASTMAATGGRPASQVVAVRKLSGPSRSENLSRLLQIQGEYFVKCTEAYEFGADLYIVLEHMLISLVQVVAAPIHPQETHVAAIVGQVLSGIKFLESKNIIHGNITCSNILLNDDGHVKIGMQECCTTISEGDSPNHPDVQAVEDIMMQLLEKRRMSDKAIGANDLRRWSSTAKGFLSKIESASAEKLLQHGFLNDWKSDDLLLLISITQVSSRRFYTVV